MNILSPDFGDHAPRVEAAALKWFLAGGDMREIAETIEVTREQVEEIVRKKMIEMGRKSE